MASLAAGSTSFFLESQGAGVADPQALRILVRPPSPDRAPQEEQAWGPPQMKVETLEEAILGLEAKDPVECW